MKPTTPEITSALATGDAVKALPHVTVDWNLNRYHDTKVDNTPSDQDAGYHIELFPIETIVAPHRPNKGINKARIGSGQVSHEYYDVGGSLSRFYVASTDDIYKYWTSPKPSLSTGMMPIFNTTNFTSDDYPGLSGHDQATSVRPAVQYGTWSEDGETFTAEAVAANKVVIKLENTWSTPNDFEIRITRGLGSVVTIRNEDLIAGWEGPGEIVLVWNGTSWVHNGTRRSNEAGFPVTDAISKVEFRVFSLRGGYQRTAWGSPLVPTTHRDSSGNEIATDGRDAFFDLIEIAAHLEADVTPWVISVDDTFDMSEVSHLYPVGTITTNVGSVTLSNIYTSGNEQVLGTFSRDNNDALIPWSNYLEPNAEVTLQYVYYNDSEEEIGRVQEFVLFSESWGGQSTESVVLQLNDFSKMLNEQTVPSAMWEDLKVPEIIWRICDSIGFNNYHIDRDDDAVTEHRIPVFYMNEEQTVWEVLDELAKASQTAIYFDNYGVLQVKTRDFAFSAGNAPVATLTADDIKSGNNITQKANIVDLDQVTAYEPNSVKVVYQKTNWSEWNRGQPSLQKVWEPEPESVVLRATPLRRNLGLNDEFIWIDDKEVKTWPYKSLVNIQGELIRYEGKQFKYYTGANGQTPNTEVVLNADEEREIQRKKVADGYQFKSHYTGALKVATNEQGRRQRGQWNSEPRTHSVEANGYNTRGIINGNSRDNANGFEHLRSESKVRLRPDSRFDSIGDLLLSTVGAADDTPFFFYGTKFRFISEQSRTHQRAGMVIHNSGSNENGYYVELSLSANITGDDKAKNDKGEKANNDEKDTNKKSDKESAGELTLYSRSGGAFKAIESVRIPVGEDIDYELDMTYRNVEGSNDHRIMVWVNGKKALSSVIGGSNKNASNGRFGMFTRGKTKAEFEYLYAVRRQGEQLPDDFSFIDKVKRGCYGRQWDREWVYRWREHRSRVKHDWKREVWRFNRQFFDEFGPIVHEIREFNVKFDPAPVLHSRLYSTNDWSGVTIEYSADPFGARFIVANTARENAVLHGEDRLSFPGTDNAVNQLLTVFGRPLLVEDAEEVLAENTDQIRARGKIEAELTSQWIQSEGMANDVAKWIRNNFTYGNEDLSVTVFGNPLIQVTDVVRVEYAGKHISGDYFVFSVQNDFDNGLNTTLGLRRRV